MALPPKPICKGFAIGSAALTALALLAAYVEEVRVGQVREAMAYVQVIDPAAQGEEIGRASCRERV